MQSYSTNVVLKYIYCVTLKFSARNWHNKCHNAPPIRQQNDTICSPNDLCYNAWGHHHHQFLLLLVEHRASMQSFQTLRSPAIPLTSFHLSLISSSIVLRHVLSGLPLLLYPWGFQSNSVFSIAPASLRNACPIQFDFLLFIWISICLCLVILHSYWFVILSVHFIFIIRLKHLFVSVCNLLVIWLVVFQVSQAHNNTDFTFVSNIRILTPLEDNAASIFKV